MDIGNIIAIGLPIGLFVVAFYARPVGAGERAHLVHSADDSTKAQNLVDDVVSKKYLSFWEYEQVLKLVERIVFREQSESYLADSHARVAIRRASKIEP